MKARTLTESGRRWLSLLMAVIMCLSLVQLNVTTARADSSGNPAATQKAKQISPGLDGGTVYYTGTGGEGSSENWDVKLTRTLEATGTENLFNVNMEVVTKDGEIEVTNSSAAVSLVLDTSGSMRYCSECGEDYGDYHTYACKYSGKVKTEHSRLTAAKAALVSFLNSYAKDENGNFYDSPRMVSLVTFAGKSQTKKWDLSAASGTQHWVNVNNQAALTYVTNLINGNQITASGGTNTDAGMLYASELLNTTTYGASIGSIDNRFCVLLTDGRPTLYLDSYGNEYGPGNYANVYTTSHAQESCAKVTATGAELYSIAYGLNGATVPVARNGGGQRNVLITDWLGSPQPGDDYQRCGSTAVYDADNAQALIDAFVNILTETNQSSTSTNGVTASIGEFTGEVNNGAYTHIGFFNNENVLVQSFNGASVTGNQIQWDLSQATYVKDEANRTTTYTLSYQVRLNNNIDGFLDWDDSGHAAAAEYNVGNASLKYQYTDAEGNVSTPEVSFPVIKAHGYLGEFDFMKIAHHEDENGDPIFLDGAPFKLSNLLNDALYKPAGTIVQEVTSQTGTEDQTLGLVAFAGIPSGYSYTLSETGEFTSGGRTYEPTDQTWTVAVSYGEVSGIPTENVKNKLKQIPDELDLTKTWQVPGVGSTAEIKVNLKRDGATVAVLTLNGSSASSDNSLYEVAPKNIGDTTWVYTITVPSVNQETGGAYVYSVEEQSLGDGFITTYGTEGLSITNTITGKTSVSVEKEWLPIDGKPMSSKPSVIVTLLANGSATSNTVTLSDANNWFHTFDGLDRYDAQGQVITYTVSEGSGSYQQVSSSGSGTQEDPFVFTNTVMDSTIDVPVSKTWNDADDDSARTDVEIELLRDGVSFSLVAGQNKTTYTLTEEDATEGNNAIWAYTFTELPQYQFTYEDGVITAVHEYEYTIKEVTNVAGYTSTTDGLNAINTRAQKVNIVVTKAWDDEFEHHNDVSIQLLRDGVQIDEKTTTNDSVTFSNLDQFDGNGVPYVYTITESTVAGYTVSYNYGEGNDAVVFDDNVGNVTVTNTLNTDDTTIDVQVTKVWQHPTGTVAPDVTFTLAQLDAKGNVVAAEFRSETLTSGEATTLTFSDLPKYYYEQETDPETGEIVVLELEYQYSVTESEIAGYVNGAGVQDPDNANSWTFTNTITGKITLEVEKVWKALPGTVYPDATIILMRNDGEMDADGNLVWEEVETFTTNSNESKSWTVDKYNENGVEYTYKVVENTVAGYSTSYSPENATYTAEVGTITVTNRLAQSEFDFVASKTWVDNGNAYDTRKDITLTLYQKANDDEVSLGTVIVGADGTLSGDGTYDGDVTVAVTDNIWTISFSSLPKYAYDNEGNVYEFTYRVAEDAVEGYTTVIANGKDITNTLKQSKTDITIHKTWVDPAETEHPDVTFVLSAQLADGSPVTAVTGYGTFPKTVTLGFSAGATVPKASDAEGAADATVTGDDWYYTWTDLPKYDDNQQLITYTVTEQSVNGYTSTRLDDVPNYFINTIKQATLNFTGEKIWDMSNAGEGDFLNPGAQPVTVALYYVNEDGSLGQMVNMPGLANPVTVDPVEGEGGIKGSFSFNGLPRYNLASGEEYRYAVREVQVTQSTEGEIGYTPIANGGTLELFVSDNDNNFSYKYTVEYGEEPTDDGPYTTVTNTYNDPEAYFYKIIGNYYTYYTDANTLIYQNEGVNLTEGGAYISLSKEERDALANKTITANTDSYTVHNGLDFVFDEDNANNVVSVTLDEVNHMYIIELNYVRHLYKLTVNYVFPEGDKPASGYEDYSDPNGLSFGDPDPGHYLGDDSYSGTCKAAPAGFILSKVTVKDSDNPAQEKETTYDGGSFANHDVIVTYYYLRDVSPQPVIIDSGFTILKTDDGEVQRAITHDAATFQLFVDEECTMPVTGGMDISTAIGTGKVEIKASELGEGIWYLKEVGAPSGYSPADTVWKIEVTYEESQVYDEDLGKFVNKQVWTLSVTTLPTPTHGGVNALDADGVLSVPNAREYGYLTITKTVSGLNKNEENTFTFVVTSTSNGDNFEETFEITVTGNGTESLPAAIQVPTGTYVVTEDSNSAQIAGYTVTITNGSAEVTTDTSGDEPANVTVTNKYAYDNPDDNKTTIRGRKLWEDDGNRDGLRPASVRLALYYNGAPIPGVPTVDVPAAAAEQNFEFTYDHYLYPGDVVVEEIGYTDAEGVYREGVVPGYEVTPGFNRNNYTVTNAHEPEIIIIEVEKIWAGGTAKPVTLRLHANGEELPEDVIVLDGTVNEGEAEYEPWMGIFPGAYYKYENGRLIDYTVTEDALGTGWSQSVRREALLDGEFLYGYMFTVTNSYTGGFGGGNDYYYRIDYVYTGKDADGNVIYSDMTTGTVKQTALDFHSFTSAATAEHDGHSFDLVGEAYQASGLTGTTFFKPHVFTVYYEFTEIVDEPPIDVPDDDVPLGDLPEDDEPLEDLPEEDVPLADVPKTGDSSMIWLAMTLISALCLAVLTIEEVKARLAAKNEE